MTVDRSQQPHSGSEADTPARPGDPDQPALAAASPTVPVTPGQPLPEPVPRAAPPPPPPAPPVAAPQVPGWGPPTHPPTRPAPAPHPPNVQPPAARTPPNRPGTSTRSGLPAVHEAWLPREHSLHRPRHGGRQFTALVCALVFFATPTVSWAFGARPSQIENRALAAFPSLSSGFGLFTGLSQWATDHLVLRGVGVRAADGVSRAVFGEPYPFGGGSSQQAGPLPGSAPTTPATPTPAGPQVGPLPGNPGSPQVIQGTGNWLYLAQDMSAKCAAAQSLDSTIAALQQLRQVIEASGRKFMFVVAPDKSTMEPSHLPDSYADKACAAAESPVFWQRITAEAGALDLRSALVDRQKTLNHPIYYQQDTHWTDEGSLVMTKALAEHLQPGISRTWFSVLTTTGSANADLPPLMGESAKRPAYLYSLAPVGWGNRTQRTKDPTLNTPQHVTSTPETGTYPGSVTMLGDSFTEGSAIYLSAVFNNLTLLQYQRLITAETADDQIFVNSKVIALQSVERVVAQGNAAYLDPEFIKQLGQVLAAHPVH